MESNERGRGWDAPPIARATVIAAFGVATVGGVIIATQPRAYGAVRCHGRARRRHWRESALPCHAQGDPPSSADPGRERDFPPQGDSLRVHALWQATPTDAAVAITASVVRRMLGPSVVLELSQSGARLRAREVQATEES